MHPPELDAGPRPHRRPAPSARVRLFIGSVLLASLVSLWLGWSPATIPWGSLAFFAVLTMLGEAGAIDLFGRGRTSVAVVPVLSAAWLFGAPGIVATVVPLALVAGRKAHSPLHRVLFNAGMLLLAAQGARWSFVAPTPGGLDGQPAPSLILLALGAGLVYYAINHLLLCLVRGLAEQRSPWQIWQTEYRWLWPYYALLGPLGLLLAWGYRSFGPVGALALVLPVGMLHLALKHVMDRTRTHVADLRRMNAQLADAYQATLDALTRALDTRDQATEEHAQRVRHYAMLLAHHLQLAEADRTDLQYGALLHDIGKIGVPDAILRKPGPLTDAERAVIQQHPELGYQMIAHIPFLARAAQIVRHHHEAYNGAGYPHGLADDAIPLGARIFAVVDAFDAMTADRPYRKGLPLGIAITELERGRGTQFDPRVVDAFLVILAEEGRDTADPDATPPP